MPQTKVREFFSKYPSRTYDTGVIIILPGETPPGVIWIESGQIDLYELTKTGEKVVINIYKKPTFFPMSWAINQEENRYFYEASQKVTVKIAPADEVLDFLKKNPDVMLDLLSRVYRGAEGILRRMSLLMAGSARARATFELIISAKRFGKKISEQTYETNMTEAELGARCGLTRETVSRELNKLKASGHIQVRRGVIKIEDIQKLEELLKLESE